MQSKDKDAPSLRSFPGAWSEKFASVVASRFIASVPNILFYHLVLPLQADGWIDEGTRAVALELSMYSFSGRQAGCP